MVVTRSNGKREHRILLELTEETLRELVIAVERNDPQLSRLFAPFVLRKVHPEQGVQELADHLAELEPRVEILENRASEFLDPQSLIVPVMTLDPEPFQLLREMQFVVRPTDDGYLATLFDANLGMTGDTREEAVANLKVLIVDIFDQLEQNEDKLGPEPARQIAVLRSFMRRRQ